MLWKACQHLVIHRVFESPLWFSAKIKWQHLKKVMAIQWQLTYYCDRVYFGVCVCFSNWLNS